MKKFLSLLCVIALCLSLVSTAFAAHVNPYATMALKDGEDTIYIGQSNYVFSSAHGDPLAETSARSLVYADATVLLFTEVDGQNQDQFSGAGYLYSLQLNAEEADPQFIAPVIGDVVYIAADGMAYYVDQADATQLMGYNPVMGAFSPICAIEGTLVELRASLDGLVVETAEKEQIYVPALNQLVDAKVSAAGTTIGVFGTFETLLDASGALSMRANGQAADSATAIDTDVLAATALRGVVYYLKRAADGIALMGYDYSTAQSMTIVQFNTPMMPEITAAGNTVFVLANDYRVIAIDAESHASSVFATLNTTVLSPVLYATDAYLLIYDGGSDNGMMPFIASFPIGAQAQEEEPVIEPAPAADDQTEPAPEATEAPAAEAEATDDAPLVLTKGSRGDDVKTLQQLLKDQGYPVGKPDGIYGGNTVTAVKYLQYDMGVKQTGKVTEDFLAKLEKSDDLPSYEKYVALEKGDKGIRVTDMQQRLHSLGYLSGKVDGDYGSATEKAVKAFEKEVGEKQSGKVSVKMLKHLFAKDAPKAPGQKEPEATKKPSSHKKPTQNEQVTDDDMISFVRWMNERFPGENLSKKKAVYKLQTALYKAGYMKKKQRTKVYDTTTFTAVKSFQVDGDFLPHPSGLPDKDTLEMLFGTLAMNG